MTVTRDGPQSVTVAIDGAGVDAVLEELGKTFGFEIAGLENIKQSEPQSDTIKGSLDSIIERLLRNRDYILVRGENNSIAKVLIANPNYGTTEKGKPQSGGGADAPPQSD